MRALPRGLVAAAAIGLLSAVAQGAPTPGLRVTPLRSAAFPDRAFVLTTMKPFALTNAQVQVRENGRTVSQVSVVPASQATSRTFGVVLVLDASASMRGHAIAGALAAARAFVAHRAAGEAIGLITFNQRAKVVTAPTTDSARITSALRAVPPVAVGTRLWDAAGDAIDVLRKGKITAGSVVLLTDGTDTGSLLRREQLAADARAAGVRIFAVGLHSSQFSPGPLRQLATTTDGAFAEALSPTSLTGIYESLSSQLAREYLVRYRSGAAPHQVVDVEVRVDGLSGAAATRYTTPGLPTKPVAPFHRSFIDRLVSSTASVVLIGLIAAVLAAMAVSAILKPGRSTLQSRVGEFVSVDLPGGRGEAMSRRAVRGVVAGVEGALSGRPSWERFVEELEIAEFPARPGPLAAGVLAASVGFALLGFFSPVLALLALAPPFLVRALYKEKLRKRRFAFEEQLPENLTVLASSLRAGHGFSSSLASVLDQADEPSRSELRRAVSDEQLGVPVEDALIAVARRMACEDLEQVALVASLQRQTGGNTAEVLDAVVASIRERFQLRRLVRALTAQGRLARWILTALPIVVAGWLTLVNPHYMSPLVNTGIGQALLAISVAMVVLGSYFVKRITEIEI